MGNIDSTVTFATANEHSQMQSLKIIIVWLEISAYLKHQSTHIIIEMKQSCPVDVQNRVERVPAPKYQSFSITAMKVILKSEQSVNEHHYSAI